MQRTQWIHNVSLLVACIPYELYIRGHFRNSPDDGQVRPKHVVPLILIILYHNNYGSNVLLYVTS
jgi:hypothetical protein